MVLYMMFIFPVIITLSNLPMFLSYSKQRGFAFIEMENMEQAETAIRELHNTTVCRDTVTVTIAQNKRKSSNQMREIYK